jgi:fumarylacetoacetate (FAA) hydrolase family protein
VNELVDSLFDQWPVGGWTALMTGTALVPDAPFSLQDGDEIAITIDGIGTLSNTARRIAPHWVPLRPRRQEDE